MSSIFHKIAFIVVVLFLYPLSLPTVSASVEENSSLTSTELDYEAIKASFDLTNNETQILSDFLTQFENSSLTPVLQKIQGVLAKSQGSSTSLTAAQIQNLIQDLEKLLEDPIIASLTKDLPTSKEDILTYIKKIQERAKELERVKEYYWQTALPYIAEQYAQYDFQSFLSHLEKGLFELNSEEMFTRYRIKGNRLFILVQPQDTKKVYIFYQEDLSLLQREADPNIPDTDIPELKLRPISAFSKDSPGTSRAYFTVDPHNPLGIYFIIYGTEIEKNKIYNKGKSEIRLLTESLKKIETQERMKGLDTTTIRLTSSGEVASVDIEKTPKFLSDPLRWFNEYFTSIHEKPQFMVSIVATVIQCSIIAAIYSLKQKPLCDQIGPLALTAVFSTIMGSFVGTYRNFIDSGALPKRILKESIIGAIFLYSFKILDSGLQSIDISSFAGILANINIIAVMYFSKMFKYPYTYIPRKMNEYGDYGPDGQASAKFLGINWNLKTVHNQFVYNVVSFGLKMVGLIGLETLAVINLPVVGSVPIDLGFLLFLSSPAIAAVINKHWVNTQYEKVLKKYVMYPSPTHAKALEKRENTLRSFRKYNYWLYSALGLLTGNFILNKIEKHLRNGTVLVPDVTESNKSNLAYGEIGHSVLKGIKEHAEYLQTLEALIPQEKDENVQAELIGLYVNLRTDYDRKMTKLEMLRQAKTTRLQRLRNRVTDNLDLTARTVAIGCASLFSYFSGSNNQ